MMSNYCLSLNVFYNYTVKFNILNDSCSVFAAQLIKYCQISLIKSFSFEISTDSSQC